MQAVCLSRFLKEALGEGAQIEIIGYAPRILRQQLRKQVYRRRPPFVVLRELHKQRETQAFLRSHADVSPGIVGDPDLEVLQTNLREAGYDWVFVGSDTVWELRPSQAAPPPPNLYFNPSFARCGEFSFAASADPLPEDVLNDSRVMEMCSNAFAGFQFLTYRDEATETLLLAAGISADRMGFMPDPTLMADFSDLPVKAPQLGDGQRQVAGIALANATLARKVAGILRGQGFRTINFLSGADKEDLRVPVSSSLPQRLGFFAATDLLVTDRFHSSIFTLRQTKSPLIFLEDSGKWPNSNSKGRDLYNRLGLAQNVLRVDGIDLPEGGFLDLVESLRARKVDYRPAVENLRSAGQRTWGQIADIMNKVECKRE